MVSEAIFVVDRRCWCWRCGGVAVCVGVGGASKAGNGKTRPESPESKMDANLIFMTRFLMIDHHDQYWQ